MATGQISIDDTGQTVAANLRRLRRLRRMRLDDVADLMSFHQRPMSKSTLSQIENGQRRVDVDDLLVFARVFKVNPAAILYPPAYPTGKTLVKLSGFNSWIEHSKLQAWNAGTQPLDPPEAPASITDSDWKRWIVVDLQGAQVAEEAADDRPIPNRKHIADG